MENLIRVALMWITKQGTTVLPLLEYCLLD
jgi:hypothetical protein